ncbi:MAG TPA: 30S ribosomal protein S1 [bacterium]|jgi:small subunit ribosomal protein S1|nr:30S ribosomal protein S1 [bacterium]
MAALINRFVVKEIESDPELADEQLTADQAEDFRSMYLDSLRNVTEGEVVTGRVVSVDKDVVLVDVGYKSEGVILIEEFRGKTGEITVTAGEEIEVYLEQMEDAEGRIVLSKQKVDRQKIWTRLFKAFENQETMEGVITRRIKGGLVLDINGVDCFLPASQVGLRPTSDLDQFIGQTVGVRIIKFNRGRGNVVASRRVLLEEERALKRTQTLQELEAGQVRRGTVKNIVQYGAFIDMGGIDGLLHITDMAWGRVSHPSEVVQIGQEIDVKILSIDKENGKISLGLKQRSADPWTAIDIKYPAASRHKGKVVNLTDYGAFVKLEEGVEGLVHVSEMSWLKRVKHPSAVVSVGQEVEVVVLNLDLQNKKISLGMKQTEADPWTTLEERLPIGSKIKGQVKSLTDYGAFVELEDGIEGLLHISDMSWTSNLKTPADLVKKGDDVEVKVLNIDKEKRKISLGLKQLQPDPWEGIADRFQLGAKVPVKVLRTTNFGAFVELEPGVEGLIHISQLAETPPAKVEDAVELGAELTARIVKLALEERKIGLSLRESGGEDAPSEG